MMEKEQYCVATLQNTIVFEGTRSECLDYIYQAIQKGQKVGYLRTTTIAELEAETIRSGDSHASVRTGSEWEGKKPCPVDRGKLLIGLECHRPDDSNSCKGCPYIGCYEDLDNTHCEQYLAEDALAYIGWLEEMVDDLENATGFASSGRLSGHLPQEGKALYELPLDGIKRR